ncbi:class I SAM-dependent methyltransferase, partial [Paracraurococcus ruber]|uniref:class I SAM-dependent methyltransferase n=1 Tax=Paracraurococcus ruber TaxID=77675 RepID=UPI001057B71F
MDTTPPGFPPPSRAALSRRLAELETGPELDWAPEHLEGPALAWVEHIPFAFWLTKVLRPRCLVELGTHYGISYGAFCQAVQRLALGTRCYAVDGWEGDAHAGQYGEEVFQAVAGLNATRWSAFSSLLRMRFDAARPRFLPGEVDLLHIDGMHTYEAVAEDFAQWRDTVADGGVVLFHDTAVHDREFGVWKLWQELRAEHPHFEFLHGHGLGVLGLGAHHPEPLRALFAAAGDREATAAIRQLFAARGATVQLRVQARALQARLGSAESAAAQAAAG